MSTGARHPPFAFLARFLPPADPGTVPAGADGDGFAVDRRVSCLAVGFLLTLAALLPPGAARVLAFAALSGAPILLAAWPRASVVEALCAGVLLSLPLWSVWTRLAWVVGDPAALPWMAVLTALAAAVLARREPLRIHRGPLDVAAAAILVGQSILLAAVFGNNGLDQTGTYLARSWWSRDAFYLFAEVQAAIESAGAAHGNPFVAGAPDLYRTFFHDGLAGLSLIQGVPAALAVPVVAPLFLAAAAGFLVPAFGAALDRPVRWADALLLGGWAAAFLVLRPDAFAYPSSQAFATGTFLLLLRHVVPARLERLDIALGALLLVALVLGHTVTSACALALVGCRGLAGLRDRRFRPVAIALLAAVAALGIGWLLLNQAPFPRSPGGTPDPMRDTALELFVGPWILPIVGMGVLTVAGGFRRLELALFPAALLALGAASYAYGILLPTIQDVLFVVFNAERFLWLALAAAGPLVPGVPRIVGALVVAAILAGALALPHPLAAGTFGLATGDALRLDPEALEAYDAVRTLTPPDARFVTTARDFALPAFTGRAQAPVESGLLWSYGAFPQGEENRRYVEHLDFFELVPEGRLAIARARGYTHALVETPLDPAETERYARDFLPGEAARLVYWSPGWALLALDGA
jgi:hypothetical protein